MANGTIEGAVSEGIVSLFDISPITTLLILMIVSLLWFIRHLLIDAKEERHLNRDALNNSTAVISELKELIRGALTK